MCGYSGHFEAGRLGFIWECACVSRPKPTPGFLIICPFLVSRKQRMRKKGKEMKRGWREGGTLLGAKVICWTMTSAWRNHTHGTKEGTSQVVSRMALSHSVCARIYACRGILLHWLLINKCVWRHFIVRSESLQLLWGHWFILRTRHTQGFLWWICRSVNLKVYSCPQARVLWWDIRNKAVQGHVCLLSFIPVECWES